MVMTIGAVVMSVLVLRVAFEVIKNGRDIYTLRGFSEPSAIVVLFMVIAISKSKLSNTAMRNGLVDLPFAGFVKLINSKVNGMLDCKGLERTNFNCLSLLKEHYRPGYSGELHLLSG
jgi:hypothetical protein